ncbi:glycoside hydrolase family 15 [Candidatus Woesearchaeota archaeon]|nr:MAG: glycoside hydrolase family 15 [Candidatus Woesearchaeota archaeon]
MNKVKHSVEILKKLQHKSGLFIAAPATETGYGRAAWIRDNVYEALGLEKTKQYARVKKAFYAILDILLKHETKIDWAIKEKPTHKYQYIHPRYCPKTFNEFWEDWGNKQNDQIGAFLFKFADLVGKSILEFRDDNDRRIVQKLVFYLESIEYWKDPDNGIWENEEELHASSIGACLAGLERIKKYVHVPQYLIENGREALNQLLPRESISRETDLALLTLIYPYNIVSSEQKFQILKDIEEKLVREQGVIRYFDDGYYGSSGKEAEWCFGFPWLAKIYKDLGNKEKYQFYLDKTHEIMVQGKIPELYSEGKPNENTPLGWAQAMYLVAVA